MHQRPSHRNIKSVVDAAYCISEIVKWSILLLLI
jgi:hypothetical protein